MMVELKESRSLGGAVLILFMSVHRRPEKIPMLPSLCYVLAPN